MLFLQEAVVKVLGSHLDEGTLESLGRAEQLSRNLSDLNELIEGGGQTDRQTDGPTATTTVSPRLLKLSCPAPLQR